ncbi:MAG: putative DNA-binding domain-containing protein [Kofleriaceae bacterium]
MSKAVQYLEAFQRELGAVLRQPLDRATHSLRATPAAYPGALVDRVRAAGVDPGERLAVYNRQYWFRLFGVLQNEYRLVTALFGAWTFNEIAERYLRAQPPRGHDLADIAEQFAAFAVDAAAPDDPTFVRIPPDALREAIAIDLAFRTAMRAPRDPELRLAGLNPSQLLRARLVRTRAFNLVDETRPLIALRRALPTPLGEHRAALPDALATGPRTWAIGRSMKGLHVTPLTPPHAALLRLLDEHVLGDALAILEERYSGDAIAANAQRWFADGVELGIWRAIEVDA